MLIDRCVRYINLTYNRCCLLDIACFDHVSLSSGYRTFLYIIIIIIIIITLLVALWDQSDLCSVAAIFA